MFQKINTYEGKEAGVRSGEVKQTFKPAWMCTTCKRIFFYKEETERHSHVQKQEAT